MERATAATAPAIDGRGRAPVISGGIALPALDAPPLDADATDELNAAAPAFGAVLKSIGLAVAASQAALDQGVVKSVESLRGKKIDVVTDVITELDDDGQPKRPTPDPTRDGKPSNLRMANVSVLNYFTPTIHEWKHVALSMDLTVGEFDASQGVRFSREQASVSVGVAVHWGFWGWFAGGGLEAGYSRTDVSVNNRQETDWAEGSVRVDAELGPRRTTNFPVPGRVERGPQIVFMPQAITTDAAAGTKRLPVRVTVRKGNGEPNPNKVVQLTSPGLTVSGSTQTDADGKFVVQLTKPSTAPEAIHRVTAQLGGLTRTADFRF